MDDQRTALQKSEHRAVLSGVTYSAEGFMGEFKDLSHEGTEFVMPILPETCAAIFARAGATIFTADGRPTGFSMPLGVGPRVRVTVLIELEGENPDPALGPARSDTERGPGAG